jgi:hypothetical protein
MRLLNLSFAAVVLASALAADASADPRRVVVPGGGRIDRRAVSLRAPAPAPRAVLPARPVPGYSNLVPQFQAAAARNTRGVDPNAAIAAAGSWGGSAGTYARNATPVSQARQGTQARQYVQPRIVRTPISLGFPLRRPR